MSTAVQTSYGFGFPKGVAGGLFDLSAHDVTTRQAEGDGVAFGLGVVVGTNKGTDVKLPATGATSDDFEGVVVHNSVMVEKDMDNNVSINSKRTLSVREGRKRIIKAVNPKMNLDGKSDSYINAAYDIAKQSFHERKSTNDQRERIAADKVRKDAKEVSNSTSARKKMIANMTGGRK